MELVNVHQLKPGDVVAAPVTNSFGAVLCPMGFSLSEGAIERLVNAGVDSVAIEGSRHAGPSLDERLGQLELRFQGVNDPVLLQIKAIVDQYYREKYA